MIRDTWDFAAEAVAHALGDEVIYAGVPVEAVYGAGFAAVDGGQVKVSSRSCTISVRFDALPKVPAEDDLVTVRGVEFRVATIEPDVEDVSATLHLKRVR